MASQKTSGFILVAAIIILGTLSVLGLLGLSLASVDAQIAADEALSTQTFYIAEAGLQHVMHKLAKDAGFRDNPLTCSKNLGNGSFSVTVNKVGNTYFLTSSATCGAIVRIITQSAVIADKPSGPFSYAMYAYNYEIDLANSVGTINGDIATAGEILNYNPSSLTVNGEVTSHANPQAPHTIDYNSLKARATQIKTKGFTFTAGNTYGAPGSEEIWYIEGAVRIESNVTIYGSIICPDRNITMDNTTGITIAPAAGEPALITNKYINADAITNLNVSGLIYAGTEVRLSSCTDTTINGAIIAGDVLVIQADANLTINYDAQALGDLSYFVGYTAEITVEPQNDWQEI